MSKKEYAIEKQKEEQLKKAKEQKLKLIELENKKIKKELAQIAEKKAISTYRASSVNEIKQDSVKFLKFLLIANDETDNYILYYEEERRVYIEKRVLKAKVETVLSRKLDDMELMDAITEINSYNSIKLGFKPLLDEFKNLDFKIEDKIFNGEWIFVNLKHKSNVLVKELEEMAKELKRGTREGTSGEIETL